MSSGIVAKVWNIKGESITKGAKEQISDSISYILNDEKTEIKLDINTLDQLTRECKYVENDLKTFSGAYVGVHNVISSDIATAVGEMMNVKKFFGKTSGRAALHMMISLPEEESDVANAPRLMQLCQDVLKELFPDNQAIFAVHTNTDNLHIHIIVNSVGLNGKKIHQDNKYIKERLQPCVNKYAKWYNFTPNSEWSKKKSASAYPYVQLKMELRDAIDMAIEKADTFESFLNNLQEQGITARIGKHISLKIPGMSKAVRTHNLGPNYTRDAIVERIISKKEKLTLQTKEEYFALIKPDNVFEPVLFQMKKYKEMSDVEKKEVIHELKLGKNPWRENREMNWQLNKIANELNQLIKRYLKSGVMENGVVIDTEEGSPQGGNLSPLLANIYLNEFDQEYLKRGVPCIRYADDIVLLAKSKRASERLLESSTKYLEERLKLTVNREKSRTVSVFAIRNFKFLGFALGRNGKGIYVRVHPKSWKKFKSRLKELSSRKRCQSIKPSLEKIKVYARGWLNYYGIASMKNNIDDINGWLYHRIRMCIWKQWKKPRTKVRNLIKMGVPKDLAMQAGNTRRGHWFATHTVAVNMAMTKERLINSGFYDLATAYQSVHVNY